MWSDKLSMRSQPYSLGKKVKQNVAPQAEWLNTHKRPPCDVTIERMIDNPRPSPCGLVVKNGSNTRPAACVDTPGPLSLTQIWTIPSVVTSLRTVSLRSPFGTPFIASQAL